MVKIPFNRPAIVGRELYYISQAIHNGHSAGDASFTKRCHALLEQALDEGRHRRQRRLADLRAIAGGAAHRPQPSLGRVRLAPPAVMAHKLHARPVEQKPGLKRRDTLNNRIYSPDAPKYQRMTAASFAPPWTPS